MIQANWLTPSFWTVAFHQIMRILNLRLSRIPGSSITRDEDFLAIVPDCTRWIMLPLGDLVAYRIRKQLTPDLPFPLQCRVGYYMGPSPDCPASILVFSTTSNRVLTAHIWKLLRDVPAPNIEQRYKHDNIFDNNHLKFTDDENQTPLEAGHETDDDGPLLQTESLVLTTNPHPMYSAPNTGVPIN